MPEQSPRLNLAANLDSRDGTIAKGALITNGYVEVISKERSIVFKRGGLSLAATLASGSGQGMMNYVNDQGEEILYATQNGTLYIAGVYSPGTSWTQENNPATLVGDGVSRSGVASFGGYMWALGGIAAAVAQNTVWYKQNATDTNWTLAATTVLSGSARIDICLTVAGRTMFAVAGNTGSAGTKEVYSTTNGTSWSLLTSSAAFSAQYGSQVLYYAGKLWLLGGILTSGAATNKIYNSVDGITWTLVNTTPTWGDAEGGASVRLYFSSVVFNNLMWVMGGQIAGTHLNDVYSSPDGVTWTQATAAAAWSIRSGASVANLGGFLTLEGGYDGSGLTNSYTTTDGITWTLVGTTNITAPSGVTNATTKGFVHAQKMEIFNPVGSWWHPSTSTAGGVSLGAIAILPTDMTDFSKNLDGTQIMFKGSNTAYKLLPATQAITAVSDAQYPAVTVRGNPYLDGTFYVMEKDGTIWGSDLEDCSSWTGTNFITAEFEPDQGICLSKYNNYIVAFGQWTTQMFWDAANPTGSPLSPVENGVMLIGCAHANSVTQLESTLLWIAQRKGQGASFMKGRFIAMLEGSSYVTVSTPDVDRILDADDLATVYSCVGSFGGHNFYILSLGTSAITLVYDLTQKLWYVWTRATAGSAVTLTSLTQSRGTATATKSGHGFSDGDPVTIAGADQAGYNLTYVNVTVVSSSVFTFPVASATVTPATGTITATPVSESYFNMVASCNYAGSQVFQESSGGKVFNFLDSVFQDNTFPINWKIRTAKDDQGNNDRKFCSAVTPIGDLYSGTGLLRYSDNDYQTNSTYRRFDMSDVKPQNQRYGNYRRRSWEWRYTGNTRARLEALEREIEQGST